MQDVYLMDDEKLNMVCGGSVNAENRQPSRVEVEAAIATVTAHLTKNAIRHTISSKVVTRCYTISH